MQGIIIIICVLSAIFAYKSNKTIYNPITVFCTIWALIVFLAYLRLFGIDKASDKTYIIIFVGIISFLFGCSVLGRFRIKVSTRTSIKKNDFTLDKKIIYILMVIALIILSFTARNSINLLMAGYNLAAIRYVVNDEVMSSSNGLLNMFFNYVAQPICQLLIPVSALNFFSKDRDYKIIVGTILAIILLIISNGGRFILMYYIIHFIFIGTFMNKHFRISKKTRNRIIVVLILVLTNIVYITALRGGSTIWKSFYTYICGCIPHMSLRISNFDSHEIYTYGFSSFQGFIRPFFTLIRKFGIINELPKLLQLAEMLSLQVEEAISIGGGIRYNAFVSLFYYFYIDFNMVGVVLISIFYGYLCKSAYYRMKQNYSNSNIIIYSLFLQSMITSMFRFQFSTFIFALTFIYLILIKPKHIYLTNKRYDIRR